MSALNPRLERRAELWSAVTATAFLLGLAVSSLQGMAQEAGKAGKAGSTAPPAPKGAAAPAPAAAEKKAAAEATPPAPPAKAEPAPPPEPISYHQDTTEEDVKAAEEKFKRDKTSSNVQKILRAQAFGAGEEAQFDAYYKQFALPRWTVPEQYGSLPAFRRDLRRDFLNGKAGAPYDRLLELSFNYLRRISARGFHPAVRYNAILMLGDLNVQEFPPGSKSIVQPYPPAQQTLLQAVKDTDSDAVRVAALVGLQRHASLGNLNPQIRDGQLIPILLELAKSPPPKDRSPEGHAWLRAMAIDTLAALRVPGPDGSVVLAMVAIVGDKDTPLLARLAAARALGSLDLKGFNALTPSQLAVPLGNLAVEVCTSALARARVAAKAPARAGYPGMPGSGYPGMPGMESSMGPMPGAMPGYPGAPPGRPSKSSRKLSSAPPMSGSPESGMYPGGMMPGQMAEDPEQVERLARLRRGLKHELNAVRLGLNGPVDPQNGAVRLLAAKDNRDPRAMANSNDPDWKFVDSVFNSVRQQISILDNDKVEEYETIRNDLIAARNRLRDYLKGGSPPAEPPKGAAGAATKKKS